MKDRFDDLDFYNPDKRLGPRQETKEDREAKMDKINQLIKNATDIVDLNKSKQSEFNLNELAAICHEANKKWWFDLETGEPKECNVGEKLMLCVSELAEAMEGDRKDLMDTHLTHRKMFEVELVDCLIRIFDLAGKKKLDLQGAFEEKMAYNAGRDDHSREGRLAPGGKKY